MGADIFVSNTLWGKLFICADGSLWPNNRGADCLRIVGVCACYTRRTLEVCCLRRLIPASEPVSASSCAPAFDDSCRLRVPCRAVRTRSGFNLQRQDLLALASGVRPHLWSLCQ